MDQDVQDEFTTEDSDDVTEDTVGEEGGDDEAGVESEGSDDGLWGNSEILQSSTPDDIDNLAPLGEDMNVSHGNTMAAKQTAYFSDGTKAVYTDTSHPDADEDLGRRAVTSARLAREMFEDYEEHGVPQITGDPEDGYFFSGAAPGYDVAAAPDEYKEAVDPDDFYRHAAVQVLLGNNDAHSNNVKVDEDGNLHWFDMDHAGGSFDAPALKKSFKYDDGWDRIFGELARTASNEGLGLDQPDEARRKIYETAVDFAQEISEEDIQSAREHAAQFDDGFASNMAENIKRLKNENVPYKPY